MTELTKQQQIQLLNLFNTKAFKLVASRYLQTTTQDPFIRNLQRELNRETKKLKELLSGDTFVKEFEKVKNMPEEKKTKSLLKKAGELFNKRLKRAVFASQSIELYEQIVRDPAQGTFPRLHLLEDLYPQAYRKLHEEYLRRNAEKLFKEGKLLTIDHVLNLIDHVKKEGKDSLSSSRRWMFIPNRKFINRPKGKTTRQTIYKWIKQKKLRGVYIKVKTKWRWLIEPDPLSEFCLSESLEDVKRLLQKSSQFSCFCFRYSFLKDRGGLGDGFMMDNIFCGLRVPQEQVHILKLPIWEKWELIKRYPYGLNMEEELRRRFSNLSPPFAVEIGDDNQANLEWLEREKIVEVVVRRAHKKEEIELQDKHDIKGDLQTYLCKEVIPIMPLLKIKSLEDLKKYLRMSAHNKLKDRVKQTKINSVFEDSYMQLDEEESDEPSAD